MTRTPGRVAIERATRVLGDPRARPSVAWLRRLTRASARDIDRILGELGGLLPDERAICEAHRRGGRESYAQIRAPFELYALVRLLGPEHVVETGVSSGVSSAHFLAALRANGHGTLHSIDQPTHQRARSLAADESPVSLPPGRSTGWAVPKAWRRGWDLRIGPAEEILPALIAELPSVGLFLHDSRHTPPHLRFELRTVRPKLRPGSIVLADNTKWTGDAFPEFARALGVPVFPKGRSDLVGLRVPGRPARAR
jgi:hypothetical protein